MIFLIWLSTMNINLDKRYKTKVIFSFIKNWADCLKVLKVYIKSALLHFWFQIHAMCEFSMKKIDYKFYFFHCSRHTQYCWFSLVNQKQEPTQTMRQLYSVWMVSIYRYKVTVLPFLGRANFTNLYIIHDGLAPNP